MVAKTVSVWAYQKAEMMVGSKVQLSVVVLENNWVEMKEFPTETSTVILLVHLTVGKWAEMMDIAMVDEMVVKMEVRMVYLLAAETVVYWELLMEIA